MRDTPAVRPGGADPPAVRPAGWWFDVVLVGAFVGLTVALANGLLLDLDTAVRDWCAQHRPTVGYWLARGVNLLGNGGPLTALCLLVAAVLAVRQRTVRPGLPVVAAFVLTGAAILPLKLWTDRAAPASLLPDRVELFNTLPPGEYSLSYPSGHLVNTVVWYGVLTLLLAPWLGPAVRRWLRIAPSVLVLGSTVYLGFHWVTDSIAGLVLGLLLDRLLRRIRWARLPLPAAVDRDTGPVATSGPVA
ncbi:MAG TPA: phosphatase PAP2 family protein, partial [Catenuloplanes sp.]